MGTHLLETSSNNSFVYWPLRKCLCCTDIISNMFLELFSVASLWMCREVRRLVSLSNRGVTLRLQYKHYLQWMIVTPNGWGLIICTKCDHVGSELSHLIKTLQLPSLSPLPPSTLISSVLPGIMKNHGSLQSQPRTSLWKESDKISPSWK